MTTRTPDRRVGIRHLLGVDLGQAQDPTAIAVAEVRNPEIHVRHLERLRLGTPYPQVIERIGALAGALPSVKILVDATGVGRAVLDHMADLAPVAVTITAGRCTSYDGRMWRVPKRALVRPLVAATEAGRLKVAKGLREAEAFQRELQAFQRRITERGNSAFEGVGEHDDLVIAAALVCWWCESGFLLTRRLDVRFSKQIQTFRTWPVEDRN